MNTRLLFTLVALSLFGVAQAKLKSFHEDFDYGPAGDENIPGWYDQTGRSEFYNKSGDPNSSFNRATGSIGFHWDEGVGQYIYVFLGTYSGENTVDFSFSVGNFMDMPRNKIQPGEFMVGIYKNNKDIPADNVDLARAVASNVVDSKRIAFKLKGSGATEAIVGKLNLSSANLRPGDRLYFRIRFTNPENHTFNVDSVRVSIK